MTTIDKLFLDAETNDEFIRQLMSSVVLATKESSNAPKGTDFEYYAMSPKFKNNATKSASETLALIDKIVGFVKPDREISLPDDIRDPSLYEQIVDAIDTLLEGADKYLDGPKKESKLKSSVNQSLSLDKDRLAVQNIKDMRKPQTDFLSDIDNTRQNPFCPRIKSDKVKFHATAKLDLKPKKVAPPADGEETLNGPQIYFAHPYETELRSLAFPAWCAVENNHVSSKPTYSQEPFTLVETESAFQQMLLQLQGASELAVDLEHHSLHTFQGLTCLIQISSRNYDFLVDALALRRLLPQLGQFFADPDVVKVLHGCDKDVLWLQRDCGLYLVNCFDTHVAAKALNYPALSLAHLLKMHCGVTADKKHQLSDWRLRPLSPEMQHYAKEDTHFLLYIYDRMRAELSKKLGRAGLEHVFDASRQLCLARYEKEPFDPLGYRKLFKESATSRAIPKLEDLTSLQDAALAAVWDWRDRTARAEDESAAALMSNSELLRIGLHLPRAGVELEQKCGPLSAYTRKSTAEILQLIADVTSLGAFAPVSEKCTSSSVVPAIEVPHSYASPRSKKSKVMGTGDNVAAVKMSALDTAYTFTPAVLASPDISQRTRPSIENITSPVLRADEIFQHAGWSTPQHKIDLDRRSYSPNIFDTGRDVVSMENRRRVQKSQEDLSKMYAAKEDHLFHSRLNALAFQTDDVAHQPSAATDTPAGQGGAATSAAASNTITALVGGETMEVPKSFEEVHQLSQRNRQRQKDQRHNESKARQRKAGEEEHAGSMDVVSDSQVWDQKALKASKIDPNFYFSATSEADIDCGVDSTLELARDLGWVRSEEEGAALKDAHLQDLSFQQADGAEADAQSGNPLRKSQEGKSKSSGNSRGAPGPLRTSGEGSLSGGAARAVKGYDYSKVPNTFVGALSVNQGPAKEESAGRSGSSSRNGKNKNLKSKHSDTLTSNNPYLFGSSVNK